MQSKILFLLFFFGSTCFSMAQIPDSIPPEMRDYFDREWTNFTSVDGLFSIRVPGAMQDKRDTVSTKIGNLVYHTYFFQDQDQYAENFLYMVSYVDYPPEAVHSDSTDFLPDFFQATVEEATFSIDGELLYQTPLELNGYPGILWRVNYRNSEGVIKTKSFLKENRFYSVQAVTSKVMSMNMAVDRFLDSFKMF